MEVSMQEVKYFCDRCHKRLNETVDCIGMEIELVNTFETDLCLDCAEELERWLKAYICK